jgi:putative ABC transport system permease protein
MYSLLLDLRYAFRQLRKSPGFTLLAVLTLAFGIGANTAMFTVVESVLLRPLPYTHPDRLVYIGPAGTQGFASTSWLDYRDIRDQTQNMDAVACFSEDVGVVQGTEGSVSVTSPAVSPSAFRMLGAQPMLGRTFTEEEGQPGGPQAVLLSEALWRQSFGGDPGIIGKTVRLNAQPRTVVGVMPKSFLFPEEMGHDVAKGVWLPLQATAEMQKDRGYDLFMIAGELKSGATFAQEQAELAVIAQHIRQLDPKAHQDLAFRSEPYQETLTGPVRPVFLALAVALGLVLLIACANVANLLIARCLVRQQEFAVRAALGATQWRLVRQLVVEGAVLSALGCGVGFELAYWLVAAVHKLPPDTIPRAEAITVHWTVVLVLAGIATATTVLSALLPALLAARTDPQRALQAASRGVGARSVRGKLSAWLVSAEVALSALLLVATGLLFHTLWNLEHARLGFDVSRVTTFTAMPADASGFGNMSVSEDTEHAPPSVAILVYKPTLERLRGLPGVQGAALDTAPPLAGIDMGSSFNIVGEPDDHEHTYNARVTAVSGGYERLMGTPIIRGRMVSDDDAVNSPFVVAINETLARKFFAGKDPLGQRIDVGGAKTGMVKPYTIVGIIGDQVDKSVSAPPQPWIMFPYQQIPTTSLFYQALLKTIVNFVVKTRNDMAVAPAVRAVFRETAPDFALDNFQTMQQAVDQSNFSQRLGLYLTGAFAGMAVLMVVAGLYGVLAQLVSYRKREFGIRLALGATPQGILRMVLRQGLVFVGAGLAVGIVTALFAGKLVTSFLYGVKPSDVWTYAGVVILLLLVGSLAAFLPARRASMVEPMAALREE